MAVKFNPFSGQLQIDEKGASASYIDGEVATYNDLPLDGTAALDSAWLVRSASGVWPVSRKQAGIYIRTATGGVSRDADFTYAGTMPDVFSDAVLTIYDEASTTRTGQFDLGSVTAGQNRVLTWPDANGTIARTEDFAAPPAIGSTTRNSGAFTTLSANNGTLTASAPVLDLEQTWNNAAVAFTGMRLNCVQTAHSLSSSYFSIARTGTTIFSIVAQNANIPSIEMGTGGFLTRIRGRTSSGTGVNFDNMVGIGGSLQFGSGITTGAGDLQLNRDAADVLALQRGTAAQTFRLYNTFTDASNYERLFLRWNANVAQIGTEKGGTGSARALALQTDGITRVTVDTTGQVGIGVAPERPFHIQGSTAFARIDRQGNFGPAILLTRMATGTTVTSSWLFGPTEQVAGVTNDDFAIIDFGTATTGTIGTQRLTISKSTGQLTVNGNLNLSTRDLVTDTTTGTKIGTSTTQKLGFFNATPIVRPAAIADATDAATTQARLNDLLAAMRSLGLIAT